MVLLHHCLCICSKTNTSCLPHDQQKYSLIVRKREGEREWQRQRSGWSIPPMIWRPPLPVTFLGMWTYEKHSRFQSWQAPCYIPLQSSLFTPTQQPLLPPPRHACCSHHVIYQLTLQKHQQKQPHVRDCLSSRFPFRYVVSVSRLLTYSQLFLPKCLDIDYSWSFY